MLFAWPFLRLRVGTTQLRSVETQPKVHKPPGYDGPPFLIFLAFLTFSKNLCSFRLCHTNVDVDTTAVSIFKKNKMASSFLSEFLLPVRWEGDARNIRALPCHRRLLGSDEDLLPAARRGDALSIIAALRNPNTNPNHTDKNGLSALMIAAWRKDDHLLTLLLGDERVDANSQDNDGETALHLAAANGHDSVVADLVCCPTAPLHHSCFNLLVLT